MEEKKTLKQRFEKASEWAKWKLYDGVRWCKDNKETVAVIVPAAIGGVVEIIKIASKRQTVNDEKALKDRYIYDRSSGHYYELKKKPKNSEWVQIDERKRHGEPLGWILNDMKLLK